MKGKLVSKSNSVMERDTSLSDAQVLLEELQGRLGMIPNMVKAMTGAPSVLKSYLSFNSFLSTGNLSPVLREKIALAVAEANQSEYCLSMHAVLGKSVGLSEEEIADSRKGQSPSSNTDAALSFVKKIMENQGHVSGSEMSRMKKAGFDKAEISEIVAHVGMTIFTSYFTRVMGTPLDFPGVDPLSAGERGA